MVLDAQEAGIAAVRELRSANNLLQALALTQSDQTRMLTDAGPTE